ncbi:hypothetical protein L915_11040, partial [Phytophthora nicotianae]
GGAKAPAKAAVRKAHAKSSKRHRKSSALKEATKVASEAVDTSGDSTVSKRRSSRRSRSPSVSSDDRPNPRFERQTRERAESPVDKAKSSSNAGDEEGKPPKNLSLAEGLQRAQAAKAAAAKAQHSKKRMASRSPLREGKETDPYYTMFDSSDEEEESATSPGRSRMISTGSRNCSKLPGKSMKDQRRCLSARELPSTREVIGLPRRALEPTSSWRSSKLIKEPLFSDNIEAARCVLLAQYQIPLKDFTTCR